MSYYFFLLFANSGFILTPQPRVIIASDTTSLAATRVARSPASAFLAAAIFST